MIVVFDASSLVGAVLRQGSLPDQALLEVVDRGTLVVSRDVIEVLAQRVEPTETVDDCRDPKDNKYLALAAAAGAEILVSSDADLLVLDPWRGVRIVTPAQFLALIGVGGAGC